MACEFIQTNTGAYNLHNRTVLPYKWSLTNTIHGVKWIENVITPMLRLVNANNLIFSFSYYVNKEGRGEILTM